MIRAALLGLALTGALALGACVTQPTTYRQLDRVVDNYAADQPQTAEQATQSDTCGAARFRHLIGTDAAAIDRSTLPPGARIITPDAMVTQDFSPGRLNIFTGTDGKVSSMRCF